MDHRWDFCSEELDRLRSDGLLRRLRGRSTGAGTPGRIAVDGREMIDLSSNDYLGLRTDPRLIRSVSEAASRWGVGSGASRLISGTTELHEQAEAELAGFHRTPAALTFSSGYALGVGVLPALAGRDDYVYLDRLCHACLYDGARLAGARLRRFRHNDTGHLAELLESDRDKKGRKVVVTDAVFSMDGDRAPLREISDICRESDALLLVDEAHAVGVLGPEGEGLAAAEGLDPAEDLLVMGTLGKAFGIAGGYVACSLRVRDYLINFARSFVFSTATPPALLAAVGAAAPIVRAADHERGRLRDYSTRLREKLRALGVDTLASTTQIVPAVAGGPAKAVEISESLRSRKIFAPAVRPPTVPQGGSRIRFSLSAALTEDDFRIALAAVEKAFAR